MILHIINSTSKDILTHIVDMEYFYVHFTFSLLHQEIREAKRFLHSRTGTCNYTEFWPLVKVKDWISSVRV